MSRSIIATLILALSLASCVFAVGHDMSPAVHGMSAFSKRATTAIATYSGPTSGTGTFYGNDGSGGACLLPARSDLKFVAWPGAKWLNSEYCGACLSVKGPKGTIDVQITNQIRSLDLSTSAFSKIGATSAGKIPISWKFVSCTAAKLTSGKVSVVWKTGTSAYWAALQIRNAAFPIRSVSVRKTTSATYTTLKRENYNYFSASSGLGSGPFVVLVRYHNGQKTLIKNVKLNSVIGDA